MTGSPAHDCAAVERDNLDLHQALTEAVRRITALNEKAAQAEIVGAPVRDLVDVLDRTSRPVERT